MPKFIVLFLVLVISFSFSAIALERELSKVPLEGDVSMTSNEKSKILHFWLSGEAAEKIYKKMNMEPKYNECLGGHYKATGDFHCFVLDTGLYHCNFGINLIGQHLRKTVVCD